MSNWTTTTLGELVTFQRGHDLPKSKMKRGLYPVIGSNGIIGYHNDFTTEAPGITIGRSGNTGKPFLIKTRSWSHNTTLYIKEYRDADPLFMYYFLHTLRLGEYAGGSAVPTLNRNHIHGIAVTVPDLDSQRKIAFVLDSIDRMVELNTQENDYLAELAMAIYVEELEYSEDELPDGWSFQPLSDFFPIKTGKKDANISTEKGKYPFFTCSQKPITADCYSFDGAAILVAGNGDFNVKWYQGKFEAYQRTYVLMPNDQKLLGYLYCAVKRNLDNITAGARGSVIKFITKGNIADHVIAVPPHPAENQVVLRLNTILECIDARVAEIKVLEELRDTLLPKLMSGEIDVSKVDLTQLNNHLCER